MDDVFLLSRIQFALTIMFHYIFPPLSIGLGAIMVIMEGTYLRTGNVIYHQMTRFWSRVFAVNFAMGVASGLVMEFQFGTNWAAFSVWYVSLFYVVAMACLCLHLDHGIWSMLQTLGWNNARTTRALQALSRGVALVVFVGFISVPVAVLAGWLR